MRIVGLSGSFRAASYHTRLLHAAAERTPAGVDLVVHDYREVPLYDSDLEVPPSVEALKAAIEGADALLFACPEYNHGIPGVLKNAIDWASRPAFRSVFAGKPVGLFSASPNGIGGVRAQAQLREVLHGVLAHVLPARELSIPLVRDAFEGDVLVDEGTDRRLRRYLAALVDWAARA